MQGRRPTQPPHAHIVPLPGAKTRPPEPPAFLNEATKEIWRETVQTLIERHIWAEDCWGMVTAYAIQYRRFLETNEHVQREGLMIKSRRGSGRWNPYLAISNGAHDRAFKLARQLGLTPASRGRVSKVRPVMTAAARKYLAERS